MHCAACGHAGTFRCEHCQMMIYCKRSCQKQHWKTVHRQQCSRVLQINGIDGHEISVTPRRIDRVKTVRHLVEAMLSVSRAKGLVVQLSIGCKLLDDETQLHTLYPMSDDSGMVYTVRDVSDSCPSAVSSHSSHSECSVGMSEI